MHEHTYTTAPATALELYLYRTTGAVCRTQILPVENAVQVSWFNRHGELQTHNIRPSYPPQEGVDFDNLNEIIVTIKMTV